LIYWLAMQMRGVRFWVSVSLLLTFMLSVMAYWVTGEEHRLIRGSPFDANTQAAVFMFVAREMKVTPDTAKHPMPKVVVAEKMSNEDFASAIGFDSGERRMNCYDRKTNTIILLEDSRGHNLAHEFVHYIQIRYRRDDGMHDSAEVEAVQHQHAFRKRFKQ
jgi:hypothetical protein